MSTGLLVGGRRAWRSPAVTHRRQWDSGSFCPGRSRSSASQSHRRGRSSGAPLLCWPESGMFARTAAAARTAMQALRSHVSLSDQPDVAISPPGGPQSGRTRPTQRATPACDAHCRTCSRVRLARDSLEQRGEGELRSHPHPVVLNCCFLRGDRQAHASCPAAQVLPLTSFADRTISAATSVVDCGLLAAAVPARVSWKRVTEQRNP